MHLSAGCFNFFICYGRCIMARRDFPVGFTRLTAPAAAARALVGPGTLVFLGLAR
jgi:hypothetical protein